MNDYMVERIRRYKDGHTVRMRTYSSWSITNLFRNGEPPVQYEYVTEYRESDHQITRTIYRYNVTNAINHGGRPLTSPFGYHHSGAWMRGQLIEKSVFDNETQSIVENHNYTYSWFRLGTQNVGIRHAYYGEEYAYLPVDPSKPNNPPDTPPIELFADMIVSGCTRKTSETIHKDGVTTHTDYQYDNLSHLFPTQITRSNSNGISTVEKIVYPQDAVTGLSSGAAAAKEKLTDQWRINTPIQRRITQNGQAQTIQADYTVVNNRAALDAVKTSVNNEAFENRVRYHRYDVYGNPVYVSCENGPGIVYLWGYNHGHPIARIENTTFDEIVQLMGGETAINNIAQKTMPDIFDFQLIRGLRAQLPHAMVTVYSYRPLVGVNAITDPSGKTVHYDYNTHGKLSQIRDETGVLQIFEYKNFQFP
jgi:YD repeat-containing protein